jgi:hypothetical protein
MAGYQCSFIACLFSSLLISSALSEAGDKVETCSDKSIAMADVDATSLLSIRSIKLDRLLEQQQQRERKQSLEHEKRLAAAAMQMPEGTSKSLLETFRICGQCKDFQRFGEANDGGYLMCMDGLQKGSVGAAYSLGVEHHDKWSADVVSTLGITVNQFDCTVEGSDCAGCKFFKKCIVAADGQHPVPNHENDGWSLMQALKETSQESAADGSLLMKMDIESSEWPIFASEPPDVLRKFGELIVEFHGLQHEWRHDEYLKAMKHISAAGFKVAHLHGNNYQDMYQVGSSIIPKVIEVTFIHGAKRPDGCSTDQLYQSLDAANDPGNDELQMAHIG